MINRFVAIRCLLLSLVSFMLISGGVPKEVFEVTWHTPGRDGGKQFVLYKDHTGTMKAIWQNEGIYVFVEESVIYEVSLVGDTLFFKNGVRLLGNQETPIQNFALCYASANKQFVCLEGTESYKMIAERPIIYSKYGWLIDLEALKSNSYDKTDFQ